MSDNSAEIPLEIIEVPPELRGPSDEEILERSEKALREVSGKRKKGERRPSKRARIALKKEKELREAQNMALEFFGNSNKTAGETSVADNPTKTDFYKRSFSETRDFIQNAFSTKSPGFSTAINPDVFAYSASAKARETSVGLKKIETTKQTSGRVLKASFGSKVSEKPKAVIVSAADLAKQRAEERARKIREALKAKISGTEVSDSESEQSAKRPRGRPRKTPAV